MPKDSIIFGAIAGFVGNAAKELISWSLHLLGYVKYTFVHIAAGYFVPQKYLNNPVSLTIGFITDWVIAGFLGVLLLQIIRRTGRDYVLAKGLIFASVVYVIMYGALMALNVTRASLTTPLPNLLLLFPHLALGLISAWFIARYDDRALYNR